jgi:hypothetical protein
MVRWTNQHDYQIQQHIVCPFLCACLWCTNSRSARLVRSVWLSTWACLYTVRRLADIDLMKIFLKELFACMQRRWASPVKCKIIQPSSHGPSCREYQIWHRLVHVDPAWSSLVWTPRSSESLPVGV